MTSQLTGVSGVLLLDSPCRVASPHTPHTESSHPPPGHKPAKTDRFNKGTRAHVEDRWTHLVDGQVTLRRVSHLVVWVWVRPAAGTVKSKEVMTVFVQTVDLILLLQHNTHTHTHTHLYDIVRTPDLSMHCGNTCLTFNLKIIRNILLNIFITLTVHNHLGT